ncbi:hypothetical protein DUZ99_18025 [Xylanibacillus composti]|uniref:Uncharacterized protein n=1 Tax=Xylanibacillus composti TaxID=1572762 RepID=A0A8J4H2M7_9BACL|nr:hypothetical protein [Xylanibacillus composti]MDT9726879.1 hypothetical protein [Xylanibacillus composti]GIQ69808.1 hypothetical protein XYCOK13_26320 [Xylanibacillus composti]
MLGMNAERSAAVLDQLREQFGEPEILVNDFPPIQETYLWEENRHIIRFNGKNEVHYRARFPALAEWISD